MNKKIFSVLGVAALLLGIGMNFQNAMNNYGTAKNHFSPFMLAQVAAADTTKSGKGTERKTHVECASSSTTTSSSSTNTTTTTTEKGASGNVGVASGSVKTTTTETTTTTTTTSTTENSEKVSGDRIKCEGTEGSCTPYDPCS
ncbi:MAG: hypothetical protein LBE91_15435 [Tannerella sp.]|jgi:hypothetical protein|nr:hypothetical protein [Tannerella sp.]